MQQVVLNRAQIKREFLSLQPKGQSSLKLGYFFSMVIGLAQERKRCWFLIFQGLLQVCNEIIMFDKYNLKTVTLLISDFCKVL
jgi:hypothetical protein